MGDQGGLDGDIVNPLVAQETAQSLESVQEIMLGILDLPFLTGRIGPGQLREIEGAFGQDGTNQQGQVDGLAHVYEEGHALA